MQVYRNQQFIILTIGVFSLIWLYLFLLPAILRKLYKAVRLDYTILITIIFLAFLNYMQAAFLSLEYWIEYHVFEASVSKTLYFLCPASFLQLPF